MSSYGVPGAAPQLAAHPDTFAGKLTRLRSIVQRATEFRNSVVLSIRGQGPQPPKDVGPRVASVPNGLLEGFDAELEELDAQIAALEQLRNSID